MRALIVESGYTRGALSGCRALARAGWAVGIGSPRKHGPAATSRYADRWHEVPRVEEDLDAFLEATERAVRQGRYEVVLCADDAQAFGLSYGRDRLSAIVPYPPHEVVMRAFDKFELFRAARRVGMPAPETTLADDRAIAEVELPVLVKSRLHWTPGAQGAPARLEAMLCSDRQAVRRRVDEIRANGGDAVLQQIVGGRLFNYTVVVDGAGDIVAGVQSLAEPLTSPPVLGMRVRSVSVPVDEELHGRATALLNDLCWVGYTSLQMLLPRGGEATLIDFNARFINCDDQDIAAGPNFPDLWARVATGRPVPPVAPARVGVRFHWLEGDLRRAYVQRRGGFLRDVIDCFSAAPGAVHTLWRMDDPAPAIFFGLRVARGSWSGVRANLRHMTRGR